MHFGPQNSNEAEIFAVEELRADIQYEILRALRDARMTQAQLAKTLGVSQAAISQFLDDDANLKVDTIARVFLALGRQLRVQAEPCGKHFAHASQESHTSGSAWSFDEQNIELAGGDTAAMLMRVIRKNAHSYGHSGKLSNDNGFYKKIAAVAV